MKKYIILLSLGAALLMPFTGCKNKPIQQQPMVYKKILHHFDNQFKLAKQGADGQPDFKSVAAMLKNELLPQVSEADKEVLTNLVTDISGIKTLISDPPENEINESNLIDALRMFTRLHAEFVRINSNDFDLHWQLVHSYRVLAESTGGYIGASDEAKALKAEFDNKSLHMAKALVDKFPNNPKAYSQLADILDYPHGQRQDAVEVLHQCLKVDKNATPCRELLTAFTDK